MPQNRVSGSDDVKMPLERRKQSIEGGPCRTRSFPIDRPDMKMPLERRKQSIEGGPCRMEADPQPTERTSSMSGPLRPDMGRIRLSSSDGEFRPDMEAEPQTTGLSSRNGFR